MIGMLDSLSLKNTKLGLETLDLMGYDTTKLALVLNRVLWDPHTGALTRVLLPLTVGFNLQLARERAATGFWPWFIAGNLHLAGVFRILPLL